MKNNLIKNLVLATIITIIGLIMDGEPKEPRMAMRFFEFFAMLATTFILFSIVSYIITFSFKIIKSLNT